VNMATARVINWGRGQAVLLPKAFRVKCKELEIWRNGDEIVLREKKRGMERALQLLESLPSDMFPDGRRDDPPKDLWIDVQQC
jgi:antitoxin VapB